MSAPMTESSTTTDGALFSPLALGPLTLAHRVVLAPLTRCRGAALAGHARTYVPCARNAAYYAERATPGGLLISEANPISIRASGNVDVPGMFADEQAVAWRVVTDAVHARGAHMICQLWHAGRATHPRLTGLDVWSASATQITGQTHRTSTLPSAPYAVAHAMSGAEIASVVAEYAAAAVRAVHTAGFDGVELHAANGYLPDQFHHSNTNVRDDAYGGSPEKRCRFTLDVVRALCAAVGADRVGVRLAPFGLFLDTHGADRHAQWTYLCRALSELGIAYVHLIEPRFDELRAQAAKLDALRGELPHGTTEVSLAPFRGEIKAPTRVIVAGGYDSSNCWAGVEAGEHDAVAFGRLFTSNADLVERLRTKQLLHYYDRATFYGPLEAPTPPETGYLSSHPTPPQLEWAHSTAMQEAQLVAGNAAAVEKET